jgi:hypothetical protein
MLMSTIHSSDLSLFRFSFPINWREPWKCNVSQLDWHVLCWDLI